MHPEPVMERRIANVQILKIDDVHAMAQLGVSIAIGFRMRSGGLAIRRCAISSTGGGGRRPDLTGAAGVDGPI
jgi:hypothetical protein